MWSGMSEFNVYTILNLPTVITFPSPRCLQWTSDGQLIFVTKSAVYVLVGSTSCFETFRRNYDPLNEQTPDHGINVDNESLVKSSIPKALLGDQEAIGWFRTMVHDSKLMEGTRWLDLSQGQSTP